MLDSVQKMLEWIARYYLQPLGRVIQMAVPSNITGRVIRGLHLTEEGVEALARGEVTGYAVTVLRQIVCRAGYTRRGLARSLQEERTRRRSYKVRARWSRSAGRREDRWTAPTSTQVCGTSDGRRWRGDALGH